MLWRSKERGAWQLEIPGLPNSAAETKQRLPIPTALGQVHHIVLRPIHRREIR